MKRFDYEKRGRREKGKDSIMSFGLVGRGVPAEPLEHRKPLMYALIAWSNRNDFQSGIRSSSGPGSDKPRPPGGSRPSGFCNVHLIPDLWVIESKRSGCEKIDMEEICQAPNRKSQSWK